MSIPELIKWSCTENISLCSACNGVGIIWVNERYWNSSIACSECIESKGFIIKKERQCVDG